MAYDNWVKISIDDIIEILPKLKKNKAAGPDRITTEAFIYGTPRLFGHLSILFSWFLKFQQKERIAERIIGFKKRMVKVLVSVVLYGSETWTLRQEDIRSLEAFEMWTWRRSK